MNNSINEDKQLLFNKAYELYQNKEHLSAVDKFYKYYELAKDEHSKCWLFLTLLNLDEKVIANKINIYIGEFKNIFNDQDDNFVVILYNYLFDILKNEYNINDIDLYIEFGVLAYNFKVTNNAILIFSIALNKATYIKHKEDIIYYLMLCYEKIGDFEFAKQYAVMSYRLKPNDISYITKIIFYNSKLLGIKYIKDTNEHIELMNENQMFIRKLRDIYDEIKMNNSSRNSILERICTLYFNLNLDLEDLYLEDLKNLKNIEGSESLRIIYAYNEFICGRKQVAIDELRDVLNTIIQLSSDRKNIAPEKYSKSEKYYLDYTTKIYYLNLLVNFNEDENTDEDVKELENTLKTYSDKLNRKFSELIYYNIYTSKIKNLIKFGTYNEVSEIIESIVEIYKEFDFEDYENLMDSLLYACCVETKLDFLTIAMDYIKSKKLSKYLSINIFKEIIQSQKNKYKDCLDIFIKCVEIKSFCSINLLDKDDKELGHYTNINNVRNLVKNDKSTRIRMYNANYMNDPDEGTIILKELGISDENIESLDKNNNPNFLFCMSKKDMLPLWIGYGNDGNGCFLKLKQRSLIDKSKTNFVYLEKTDEVNSTKKTSNKEVGISLDAVIYNYRAKPYKADDSRAYEVIYLSRSKSGSLITGNRDLNNLIDQLKTLVDKVLNKNDDILLKILDEIRFLFKSSTYAVEEEKRIIKKVSDKSKYKLDDRPTLAVPKLFVEIENSGGIEFEEIMIGPKVSDKDKMLLVPYFKYCDDKIKVTYSSINYR